MTAFGQMARMISSGFSSPRRSRGTKTNRDRIGARITVTLGWLIVGSVSTSNNGPEALGRALAASPRSSHESPDPPPEPPALPPQRKPSRWPVKRSNSSRSHRTITSSVWRARRRETAPAHETPFGKPSNWTPITRNSDGIWHDSTQPGTHRLSRRRVVRPLAFGEKDCLCRFQNAG